MLMINGLACLLIITSLCVIMVRTAKKAALFYSLQSLVLVLLFVYLANEMQAHELYMWSISAFYYQSGFGCHAIFNLIAIEKS